LVKHPSENSSSGQVLFTPDYSSVFRYLFKLTCYVNLLSVIFPLSLNFSPEREGSAITGRRNSQNKKRQRGGFPLPLRTLETETVLSFLIFPVDPLPV